MWGVCGSKCNGNAPGARATGPIDNVIKARGDGMPPSRACCAAHRPKAPGWNMDRDSLLAIGTEQVHNDIRTETYAGHDGPKAP
jgi:hypothetical protein